MGMGYGVLFEMEMIGILENKKSPVVVEGVHSGPCFR